MPRRKKAQKRRAVSEKKELLEKEYREVKKGERHDHLKAAHELMLRRKKAEAIKTKKYI